MATFVSTLRFTGQGLKNLQSTRERADDFKAAAVRMGVDVKNVFWTLGPYDGLLVFDAPDDETATALMLQVTSMGNVHSQTARAYDADEMEQILAKASG